MGNFRKAIASLSLVAILSSFVVTSAAFAAYSDVPADHWAYDAVTELEENGVLTPADNYRPNDPVVRAEVAKMLVLQAGLEGDSLCSERFEDCEAGQWYDSYLGTSYQNSIFRGNDDGMMLPGANINRADLLVVLHRLHGESADYLGNDYFPDVPAGSYYDAAVGWGYCHNVVGGYGDGTYRPGNEATRAETAVMIVRSYTDMGMRAACTDDGEPGEPGETPVSSGDLTVSVSDDTPEGRTIPKYASSVEMVSWDFEAGDDDAVLQSLTVHQFGVYDLPTGHQVYLYEGNNRLTSGRVLNSTTRDVTFNNLNWKIDDNDTRTLTLRMDIGNVTTVGEVGFEIESASAVTAGGTVGGSFPARGELFGTSGTEAGTVTVEKNGTVANPKVGEDDVTIAKFKLTTATEAAMLKEFGLYITGNVSTDAIENLELYVSGEDDPIATVEGLNSKDIAAFDLEEVYEIAKGDTRSFWVQADLNTGRADDTIKAYIDETTDIVAVGDVYGFGMRVDIDQTTVNNANSGYDGTICTSSAGACTYSTVEGGDITVSSNGPTAQDIAIAGNDVSLMDFSVTAVAYTRFRNLPVQLTATEPGAESTGGLLRAAGTPNFTDIKIIDRDTGATLMGPVDADSFVSDGVGGNTPVAVGTDAAANTYLFTDEFEMEAGEELNLSVVADVENYSELDGSTIVAALPFSSSYPEMRDVNNKVVSNSTTLVPASTITGKTMTVSTPSLTLSLAAVPVSQTYVKGQDDIQFLGISAQCGSASDCMLDDVTVSGYIDDNGNSSAFAEGVGADHTTYLNEYVGSVWLEDSEGNVIASAKPVQSSGVVNFTSIDWNIDGGDTEIIYVVGDLSSDAYKNSNPENIAFEIDTAGDITYVDDDGNTRASVGTVNTAPSTVATTSEGGTLTVAVDAATPKENILVAGATGQSISSFKFTTTDEPFLIDELSISNRDTTNPGDWDNNVVRVKLAYTNSDGASETKTAFLTNGVAQFSGMDFAIDKDDNAVLTVTADLNTIEAGATAGEFVDFNLALNNFEALAVSSGETYTAAKMADTDADGSISDEELVIRSSGSTAFQDSDFVNTVAYTNDATDLVGTTTLGGSASFTVDNNGADQTDLPVGTLLCMTDAGGDTVCDSSTDDIYVVTAWSDGANEDTVTATLINSEGDGTYDAADEILYAIPGEDYLTDTNQMHVYESKPVLTLHTSSPKGDVSTNENDTVMAFTVSNPSPASDSVKIRQESNTHRVSTDSAANWNDDGTGDGVTVGTSTTVLTEGTASITLTEHSTSAVTDYAYINVDTDNGSVDVGTEDYAAVSFWIKSTAAKAAGDLQLVMDDATDMTAGDDEVLNIAALTANTWSYQTLSCSGGACGDANTDNLGINIQANPDNSNVIYLDGIRLQAAADANDKIQFTLSSDASMTTTADNLRALLKEGGTTVAEAGINLSSASTGTITFYPYGPNYTEIEIPEGESKLFSLVLDTTDLITDQSGTEDKLTPYITLGTSSGGAVTAGGFVWYDTNSQVSWVGHVENTNFSGSTLNY